MLHFLYAFLQGFFRRCIVKMKKKEEYKCLKDKKCKLGGGKRMSCSYCRYQKCLAVGMSHDGKFSLI